MNVCNFSNTVIFIINTIEQFWIDTNIINKLCNFYIMYIYISLYVKNNLFLLSIH